MVKWTDLSEHPNFTQILKQILQLVQTTQKDKQQRPYMRR